ncbi:unnamed protein product [Lampetra planeri]
MGTVGKSSSRQPRGLQSQWRREVALQTGWRDEHHAVASPLSRERVPELQGEDAAAGVRTLFVCGATILAAAVAQAGTVLAHATVARCEETDIAAAEVIGTVEGGGESDET